MSKENIERAIGNFPKQFAFVPEIIHREKLGTITHFVVAGMGGSAHPADILLGINPTLPITVHRDYGLPEKISRLPKATTLVIASSYSGNTEESIDALRVARQLGYPVAVISKGGALLKQAQEETIPHVVIPETQIQPRMAIGFSFMAMAALMGEGTILSEAKMLVSAINPDALKLEGQTIASAFRGRVPIVYASARNAVVAYNWKIKLNETGKIPAFMNVFPELNHNEINGYDDPDMIPGFSNRAGFLLLPDVEDSPRVSRRMDVTETMFRSRGFMVMRAAIQGTGRVCRIFTSLLLADWVACFTASEQGKDPEVVLMVEEFKKLLA